MIHAFKLLPQSLSMECWSSLYKIPGIRQEQGPFLFTHWIKHNNNRDWIETFLSHKAGAFMIYLYIRQMTDIDQLCHVWDYIQDLPKECTKNIKKSIKTQILQSLLPDWEGRASVGDSSRVQTILNEPLGRAPVLFTSSQSIFRSQQHEAARRIEQNIEVYDIRMHCDF